jgi:quercetin dioxygenase-like cupin family protein
VANRGDIIENPLLGERIVIRQTGRESGGATLQLDVYQRPGSPGPVEHLHPAQEERFEVVSGTMIARVAGHERRLGPGERIVIPTGTPHTWSNGGEGELHLRAEFRPALETERFFELMAGLARDGKTNSAGAPRFLQMVPICRAYDIWLPRPPVPLQRALFALLAPVARLRGLRASYPEYGSRAATAAPVPPAVAGG